MSITPPPEPFYSDSTITLHHGDCLDILRDLPDASVDSVVTDPPYGLEFMGKEWDGANGFRRSLNPNDAGRDNAFGRTSRTSPEYNTGRGARVLTERAAELTVRGKGHSTSAGPYLATGVDSTRVAGRPFQEWCEAWSRECLRVLKPGGHMLAFGGTRTFHRLACAVEDAGFEVRDSLAWLYGSGFPKSLNLVDENGERTGWGTALKPAFEPVVVARKPLVGTVAANVLAHGTGALNIDGCRVQVREGEREAVEGRVYHSKPSDAYAQDAYTHDKFHGGQRPIEYAPGGRWPANVVLDGAMADALDEQSGESQSRVGNPRSGVRRDHEVFGQTGLAGDVGPEYNDLGGASRFFFVAEPDQGGAVNDGDDAERGGLPAGKSDLAAASNGADDAPDESKGGLIHPPAAPPTLYVPEDYVDKPLAPIPFLYAPKADASERVRVDGVAHPTVKPLALMRWLVRLVTPPGGTVLEPFAGSGTTVEACLLEGFRCVAIEREADYLPLIRQRIHRRRDPVEAVKAAGDDGGLFDLLDGGAA